LNEGPEALQPASASAAHARPESIRIKGTQTER